ncbi:unnamed protein product [Chrysodeixis includens]|uniref:Uncharacterized protein n=1 Tax=Chrysodeixis includens TaxID=689277 RepID=A0A9N8L428_CHRIL|nr:unnamed protein product [Chrysodeixis includens]
MKTLIRRGLLLVGLSLTWAKDADLPLCPTNLQYFPQNLPMHCRLPGSSGPIQNPDTQGQPGQFPALPPQFGTMPPYYQSPPPNKQPNPIPIPIPPFQGLPGGMPPGQMGPPMPMPMPMIGGPPHKLPVIVMPFYSPDTSFKRPPPETRPKTENPRKKKKKKKRKKKHSHDSDTDSSADDNSSDDTSDTSRGRGRGSDEYGWWPERKKKKTYKKKTDKKITRRFNQHHSSKSHKNERKNKELLTPILQYVTKDGYVIFEKKISTNEAKDWLKPSSDARAQEEAKNEEKNVLDVLQKSVEETTKAELVRHVAVKEAESREKSDEEEGEEKENASHPTPKSFGKKHRQVQVGNLINPGAET